MLNNLPITETIIKRNDSYRYGSARQRTRYLMLHSTATKGILAHMWYERWNKSFRAGETNRQVSAHAFVDDKGTHQLLPWNWIGWHSGNWGTNQISIGIEMCEDLNHTREFMEKTWENSVFLAAYLLRMHQLDETAIISHREGYRLGIASNHGDPEHWIGKFGRDMNLFRSHVKSVLAGKNPFAAPVVIVDQPSVLVLRRGSTGPAVKRLQEDLISVGYGPEDNAVDGSFGPMTERAVRNFQTAYKLTVDGIAGPKTQAKLAEVLAATYEPEQKEKFQEGDKVRVKDSVKTYATGQEVPGWVKGNTYEIIRLDEEKALLNQIISWFRFEDLELQTQTPTPKEEPKPQPQPEPTPTVVVFGLGDKSAGVTELQKQLIAVGHPPADNSADGSFGRMTENAVRSFQTAYKLTVDGIAGPQTQGKLKELLSKGFVGEVYNVGQVNLRIRSAANLNAPQIGSLPSGRKVKVLAKVGNWYSIEVAINISKNTIGFVSSNFIKR